LLPTRPLSNALPTKWHKGTVTVNKYASGTSETVMDVDGAIDYYADYYYASGTNKAVMGADGTVDYYASGTNEAVMGADDMADYYNASGTNEAVTDADGMADYYYLSTTETLLWSTVLLVILWSKVLLRVLIVLARNVRDVHPKVQSFLDWVFSPPKDPQEQGHFIDWMVDTMPRYQNVNFCDFAFEEPTLEMAYFKFYIALFADFIEYARVFVVAQDFDVREGRTILC
jgi:hypothetical protein